MFASEELKGSFEKSTKQQSSFFFVKHKIETKFTKTFSSTFTTVIISETEEVTP